MTTVKMIRPGDSGSHWCSGDVVWISVPPFTIQCEKNIFSLIYDIVLVGSAFISQIE